MDIRPMTENDAEEVSNIIKRNLKELMHNYHSKEIISNYLSQTTSEALIQQMHNQEIYVVEFDREIIAVGGLADFGTPEKPRLSISNLFVKPEKQRKGFGKRFFEKKLYVRALERNADWLYVPSSRNAIPFYGKLGFTIDKIQDWSAKEATWMSMKLFTNRSEAGVQKPSFYYALGSAFIILFFIALGFFAINKFENSFLYFILLGLKFLLVGLGAWFINLGYKKGKAIR